MKIIENKNAKWTIPRIEALEKYGPDCLGITIDAKWIAEQKIKITQGVSDSLLLDNIFMFEIYNDNNNHAGDINISKWDDGTYELSIVIFNKDSHLSKQAIIMVLEKLRERKIEVIEAVVLKTSCDKDKMLCILNECGFNNYESDEKSITLIKFLTNQSS